MSEPPGGWDRPPSGDPGATPRAVLLHGGDAFRHGDLAAWTTWARRNARAVVDLEGPAASLAGEDAAAIVDRLAVAGLDGLHVVLPTVDAARTQALVGEAFEPRRALDSMVDMVGRCPGLGLVVTVPVNVETVGGVRDVIAAIDERLGDRVVIQLRRSHAVRGQSGRSGQGNGASVRLPVVGHVAPPWDELSALSEAIAALPEVLPGGADLTVDPMVGYAPCMLAGPARRPGLFTSSGVLQGPPNSALGDACAVCAWRRRCTFSARAGAPPPGQIMPLHDEEALALQLGSEEANSTHKPHGQAVRWDRREKNLPNLLCVAPWTSMVATEPNYHPVPCALSWVDTAVRAEQVADVMETSVELAREQATALRPKANGHFHVVDNHALTMLELWNNPLLRVMRREMLGGQKSSHCRDMCRTVMGVEDRSADLLARPDNELTPAVIANRNLLLEEIRAGKTVLRAKPLEIVMGVASHCNITCGFCVGPGGKYGELTDARRDEIIALLPTLMSFSVSGPGEPLMSRNYLAILDHIAEHDLHAVRVALTTNGTLLTPSFLRNHAQIRWAHVRISLNAGSKKTHERMTGKQLFDRVMENLEALVALRDATSPPFDITLSCVLSEMVMGDLHNFARIATRLRTRIVVEPMYGDLEALSPWTRPSRLAPLADELRSVAEDFALENPPLSRAFRAVEEFARSRLASGDFGILAHH